MVRSPRWHASELWLGASLLFCSGLWAEEVAPQQGAGLLKTDILCVLAHPDDETGLASTVAACARGQQAVVAHVYCTRGEGGGNMVGTHLGPSLGMLREAELRDCLAELGVRYCYFLDRLDWAYTESAEATFRKWDKEDTLEKLVRVVRALRPEIILTMNPMPRPGQHGHHQAAGILATEAFAAAADPARFPHQLDREGLTAWQPRRLFYSGSAGPVVARVDVSSPLPGGTTAAEVAAKALSHHRSQAFGNIANSPWLSRPQSFALIKSFTPVTGVDTNLLARLPVRDTDLAPIPLAPPTPAPLVSIEFGARPAQDRFRAWVQEQGLAHILSAQPPDLTVVAGEPNRVAIRFQNRTRQTIDAVPAWELPAGWTVRQGGKTSIPLRAETHGTALSFVEITPPQDALGGADISLRLERSGQTYTAKAHLQAVPRTPVPRVKKPPALDGTDRGWEQAGTLVLSTNRVFQGRVESTADNSAEVRLAHDTKSLFLDVRVKDDLVVTNIAPNDIKGHWRSDSVEICLDPNPGSEDTFGCFKLGIFPSDTAGAVRAARDADARPGLIEETAPGTQLIAQRTADGYRLQLAVPFRVMGITPKKSTRLGFNVIIYDGDKPSAAVGENINQSRIAWSPRAGVPGRPEDWGRIDLE